MEDINKDTVLKKEQPFSLTNKQEFMSHLHHVDVRPFLDVKSGRAWLKTPEDIPGPRKNYYKNQGRVSKTLRKTSCQNMNHVFYKAVFWHVFKIKNVFVYKIQC